MNTKLYVDNIKQRAIMAHEIIIDKKYLYESEGYWGGADLIIKNSNDDKSKARYVLNTKYNRELIWLIKRIFESFKVDYISKYDITKVFAESAKKFLEHYKENAEKEQLLLYVLSDVCDVFKEKAQGQGYEVH